MSSMWKKTIRDDKVIHGYYRFRDQRIVEMADEFLSSHDIKIDWDDRHTL